MHLQAQPTGSSRENITSVQQFHRWSAVGKFCEDLAVMRKALFLGESSTGYWLVFDDLSTIYEALTFNYLEPLGLSQFKQWIDGIQERNCFSVWCSFVLLRFLAALATAANDWGAQCRSSQMAVPKLMPTHGHPVWSSVANPGIFIIYGHHHYVTHCDTMSKNTHQIKLRSLWLCFWNQNYHVWYIYI